MASIAYEQKRESKQATAVWTVKVSFPAFESLDAKTFLWSTSNIEVDDEIFQPKLTTVPKGRHQRDRGNDYAEFVAANSDSALYNEFFPYEDLIERAEVVIKECYEIEYRYFESETRFFGYLKDFKLSGNTLNFTAMSDLSRSGFLVGGRILTRERCGTGFNVNGLLSPDAPDFDACGWQTIQGGNPLFCSKFLKGVDGCEAHNNSHRFYAIKGLSDAAVQMITGNASGFEYHSGGACFIAGTLIVMADWTLKRIELIEKGDWVMGFNVFTDRLEATKVISDLQIHEVDEYENGILANKNIERNFGIRREHLFSLGSAIFKPYGATIGETVQGVTKHGKRATIDSRGSETVFGKVSVYNFQTGCGTYHISDPDMEIIAKVHNSKPMVIVA